MSEETVDRLTALLEAVTALRDDVAADGRALFRAWESRITRQAFAASALNFGHYLALRRLDLRERRSGSSFAATSSFARMPKSCSGARTRDAAGGSW